MLIRSQPSGGGITLAIAELTNTKSRCYTRLQDNSTTATTRRRHMIRSLIAATVGLVFLIPATALAQTFEQIARAHELRTVRLSAEDGELRQLRQGDQPQA